MRVHFLLPEGVDDPRRPSGGNVYDRRLVTELTAAGWHLSERAVTAATLPDVLSVLPDGAPVLVDGLVASTTDALVAECGRLRVVVLLHMPHAGPHETEVLGAAAAVVAVSDWVRGVVVEEHGVPPERVHVARPGVDADRPATGSAGGRNLLCVGPVTRAKGYDVLLRALAGVRDLAWHCRCVGALDLEPPLVDELYEVARRQGIADRVAFSGPLSREGLETLRATSDLMVAPSRRESFGMAVAEGVARGIPAVVTDVGGHAEAVGEAGLMVPVDDPSALAAALRRWLGDAGLRRRLRAAAAARAPGMGTWADTAAAVARVLADLNRGTGHDVLPGDEHADE